MVLKCLAFVIYLSQTVLIYSSYVGLSSISPPSSRLSHYFLYIANFSDTAISDPILDPNFCYHPGRFHLDCPHYCFYSCCFRSDLHCIGNNGSDTCFINLNFYFYGYAFVIAPYYYVTQTARYYCDFQYLGFVLNVLIISYVDAQIFELCDLLYRFVICFCILLKFWTLPMDCVFSNKIFML